MTETPGPVAPTMGDALVLGAGGAAGWLFHVGVLDFLAERDRFADSFDIIQEHRPAPQWLRSPRRGRHPMTSAS